VLALPTANLHAAASGWSLLTTHLTPFPHVTPYLVAKPAVCKLSPCCCVLQSVVPCFCWVLHCTDTDPFMIREVKYCIYLENLHYAYGYNQPNTQITLLVPAALGIITSGDEITGVLHPLGLASVLETQQLEFNKS